MDKTTYIITSRYENDDVVHPCQNPQSLKLTMKTLIFYVSSSPYYILDNFFVDGCFCIFDFQLHSSYNYSKMDLVEPLISYFDPMNLSIMYDQEQHLSLVIWEGQDRGTLHYHEHT